MTSSVCITKAAGSIQASLAAAAVALILRDLYDALLGLGADDAAEDVATLTLAVEDGVLTPTDPLTALQALRLPLRIQQPWH